MISELFYTEKCHVRNLKILDKLFYRPMLKEQAIPQDFTKSLFPNLETMIVLHGKSAVSIKCFIFNSLVFFVFLSSKYCYSCTDTTTFLTRPSRRSVWTWPWLINDLALQGQFTEFCQIYILILFRMLKKIKKEYYMIMFVFAQV